MRPAIEAAGGVVWRRVRGRLEVVLVHRPLRDDRSLPVGRLEPGESPAAAAIREVAEETGYRCRLGALLDTIEFTGADDGRVHRFHIYAMRPVGVGGSFEPNAETDRIEWLTLEQAVERASYANVCELLARLEHRLPPR